MELVCRDGGDNLKQEAMEALDTAVRYVEMANGSGRRMKWRVDQTWLISETGGSPNTVQLWYKAAVVEERYGQGNVLGDTPVESPAEVTFFFEDGTKQTLRQPEGCKEKEVRYAVE